MVRVEKLDAEFLYPSKGEYDPKSILAQSFGIHTYGTGPSSNHRGGTATGWKAFVGPS